MSEKLQHTAASMREKMLSRYGDCIHHKHNKLHSPYRLHCKSHPVENAKIEVLEIDVNCRTGNIREFKLRKFRKQLDKRRIH